MNIAVATPMSAPDTSIPLHPITEKYADFTADEIAAMRMSLKEQGLLNPIVKWNGQIVDGRHREKLCRELNVACRYDDISHTCPTEEAMRKRVIALNQHRRARTTPLKNVEKRARVEAELRADPARSDVAIAKAAGVALSTAQAARKKLDAAGVTETVAPSERKSTTGKIGEGQKSRRARTVDELSEIATRVEAELRKNSDESNSEIARQNGVGRDFVANIRAAIAEGRDISNRRGQVKVPSGKSLSDAYREVMALEEAGEKLEQAGATIGVGLKSYRVGRDMIRLATNKRLSAEDAARVSAALSLMDKQLRPDHAYEQIRDIADKIWGSDGYTHRGSKREKAVLERYMNVLVVLAEAAEQASLASVPYLDEANLEQAYLDLNGAASSVKEALKHLKESREC